MTPATRELRELLEDAFERAAGLLANLTDVAAADYDWRPERGMRSIREILQHSAYGKHLYANHLFGDASATAAALLRDPRASGDAALDEVVAWMREAHDALVSGTTQLADDDLAVLRTTHWGQEMTVGGYIRAAALHDVYHAGEINHLRALRQGNDEWWPEFRPSRRSN
jgi:uncharacterized damage-inducible protein DinB